MRQGRTLLIAAAAALALRLFPYFLTEVPFSPDAWGPIGNALTLASRTPIDLSSNIFDGYNNYWPGNALFMVAASRILGIGVVEAGAALLPVAGALSIIPLAAAAARAVGKGHIPHVTALLMAFFFPSVMMCGGATKECYAYGLMNTLLLLTILSLKERAELLQVFSISLVLAAGLSLTHHFTLLITATLLASTAALTIYLTLMRGKEITPTPIVIAFTVAATGAIYNAAYGASRMPEALPLSDAVSLAAYAALFTSIGIAAARNTDEGINTKPISPWSVASIAVVIAVPTLTLLISLEILQPLAFMPTVPATFSIYSLIFSGAAILALLGYTRMEGSISRSVLLIWAVAALAFPAYALISEPLGASDIAYRSFTFVFTVLSLIAGAAFIQGKGVKYASILLTLIIVLNLGVYAATITGAEAHTGHFWLYRPEDLAASAFLSAMMQGNATIGTDARIGYLLRGLHRLEASVELGKEIIEGGGETDGLLITYREMFTIGFIYHGGEVVKLPEGRWSSLTSEMSILYCDGWASILS